MVRDVYRLGMIDSVSSSGQEVGIASEVGLVESNGVELPWDD